MDSTYYIVRCDRSGVFAGNIKCRCGSEVMMTGVRCIWYWDGAASLLQLAKEGSKDPDACKFTVEVDELTVIDAIEIIPCSADVAKQIKEVKAWRRN